MARQRFFRHVVYWSLSCIVMCVAKSAVLKTLNRGWHQTPIRKFLLWCRMRTCGFAALNRPHAPIRFSRLHFAAGAWCVCCFSLMRSRRNSRIVIRFKRAEQTFFNGFRKHSQPGRVEDMLHDRWDSRSQRLRLVPEQLTSRSQAVK